MASWWQRYNQEDYLLEHENLVFLDDEEDWPDEEEVLSRHATLPSNAVFHEGPIN
ncbi:MAG: hypothetical protein ACM3O9_04390 [Methylocystaceae bacterium]